MPEFPSRTEEMLLLVVCRLQEDAFGLDIRQEVEALTDKRYSIGGIYVPLDRLVKRGWLKTENGLPGPGRMGRPRRRYQITSAGLSALRASREMSVSLWSSLPAPVQRKLGIA